MRGDEIMKAKRIFSVIFQPAPNITLEKANSSLNRPQKTGQLREYAVLGCCLSGCGTLHARETTCQAP